jgi:hypothetical protein
MMHTYKSLIYDKTVTTQNPWFFRSSFKRFWSAIIFYECNDDTTALQRRVLQTALWHYTMLKVNLQTFLSTPVTQKCQILSCDTLVANERTVLQQCFPNLFSCSPPFCFRKITTDWNILAHANTVFRWKVPKIINLHLKIPVDNVTMHWTI